ncbi:uncharacterized protein ATNIH1004_008834 [Aspergillus tanneri]|uniref:Uncharacterized protein n=1 Tax=Aspergillus tanneri TaxID=1220188 RepID=A0A5M9MCH1_9EURO|nr:uncharacterized protein ATNIH1004_008834 [Aspergillus tanneri]KAA8644628.1 hypothetical protein ATNIH1004_008834 [Aspergillus tanneri]
MSDPNPLLLLVQQLQQELQNQRLDIQNQRNEIQQLRADLDASRTDVHQLRTQLLSVQTPRSRLPDPPRFNGKPYTLRTWLPSIKAKLRSDQLVGADAFDYVWDRLEQSQQASVLHLRQSAEENQLWDPEVIFSFFSVYAITHGNSRRLFSALLLYNRGMTNRLSPTLLVLNDFHMKPM